MRSTRAARVDFDEVRNIALGAGASRLLVFRPGTAQAERGSVATYAWIVRRGMWVPLALIGFLFWHPGAGWDLGGLITRTLVAAAFVGGAVTVSWLIARRVLEDAVQVSFGVSPSLR